MNEEEKREELGEKVSEIENNKEEFTDFIQNRINLEEYERQEREERQQEEQNGRHR